MEETRENVVTMVDEEGNERDFEVIEVVAIHQQQYALLAPVGAGEEEEQEVLILRVVGDSLEEIEDDAEFEHVVAHLEGHAAH